MTHFRFSLLLLLATVVPGASFFLRRGTTGATSGPEPPIPQTRRRGRKLLDGNQIQFSVRDELGVDFRSNAANQAPRQGYSDEYKVYKEEHDKWVTRAVQAVADGDDSFDLQSCDPSEWVTITFDDNAYPGAPEGLESGQEIVFRYTCTFDQLAAPEDVSGWVASIASEAGSVDFVDSYLRRELPANNIYRYVDYFSADFQTVAISNDGERRTFLNSYVLPYTLSWEFDIRTQKNDGTPQQEELMILSDEDYAAVQDATQEWLTINWDRFYGAQDNVFARKTIRVNQLGPSTMYTETGGNNTTMYAQSIPLDVQLLIGANGLDDVPSVTQYTTTMRYFYRISDFIDILQAKLTANSDTEASSSSSALKDRTFTQTTYSIIPSYQVTTLAEAQQRGDPSSSSGEEGNRPQLPSIAVVSASLPGK